MTTKKTENSEDSTKTAKAANSAKTKKGTNSTKNGSNADRIASLRPIDDELAYLLFRDNHPLVELLCSAFLTESDVVDYPDIKIVSVHTQHEMFHLKVGDILRWHTYAWVHVTYAAHCRLS